MIDSRRALPIFLRAALLSLLIAGVLWLSRYLEGAQTPAPLALLAAGGAVFYLFLTHYFRRVFGPEHDSDQYDPLTLAQELGVRTAGVMDVAELAHVTADLAEERLGILRCAWLLLTPAEGLVRVERVPGRGRLAPGTIDLTRANPLLRQLDLQRRPVQHGQVDWKRSNLPQAELAWLRELDMQVYVPVFDAGVLSAILAAGAPGGHRARAYRPADLEWLLVLASQAGAALKAMRVIADLKRVNASMSTLNASLRQSMDALEKMDAARSDFLAIASHELRTPLSQLLGFADLLGGMAREGSVDAATVTDITGSIVRACSRLDEVIGQMLEMAELDAEAIDLNYGETTLEQILRRALEPYAPALRERRLALSVRGLRDVPPLRADEARLVRAFSQLISNAIKYTPDGGRIEISTRLLPVSGDQPAQLEAVVADGGIGLDPQHHQLIFQKFYRVGSTAAHSTGSTKFMGAGPGLGLPIARGVIVRHGGRIWVESPGHDPVNLPGSRFYVVLPLRPPAFMATPEAQPAKDSRKEVSIVPSQRPFVGLDEGEGQRTKDKG